MQKSGYILKDISFSPVSKDSIILTATYLTDDDQIEQVHYLIGPAGKKFLKARKYGWDEPRDEEMSGNYKSEGRSGRRASSGTSAKVGSRRQRSEYRMPGRDGDYLEKTPASMRKAYPLYEQGDLLGGRKGIKGSLGSRKLPIYKDTKEIEGMIPRHGLPPGYKGAPEIEYVSPVRKSLPAPYRPMLPAPGYKDSPVKALPAPSSQPSSAPAPASASSSSSPKEAI